MKSRITVAAATLVVSVLWMPAMGVAQGRYRATRTGDVVQLEDATTKTVVNVLTTASNAYQMTVKGEDVIRRTWTSLDDIRERMGLNGVPLLFPYANRLDEQAFYANGQKYTFDPGLGNTGRGAIPMHGYVTGATEWKTLEVKADATGAWITSRLDFYKNPNYMKQFPFANTVTMTYRLSDGALEVRTRIDNMSDQPMPVAVGFHPYFQLSDSSREEWTLSIPGKTHWILNSSTIPTGETEPVAKMFADPHNVAVKDVTLDDVFTDLERDAQGRATATLRGRTQQLDVTLGPNFKALLVLSRTGGGGRRGGGAGAPAGAGATSPATPPPAAATPAATTPATPTRGTVAFEPMAGISNSMNLAQKGLYKELQSIAPGGFWQESFWIRPRNF